MFSEHLAEIRRALASLLALGVDHALDGGESALSVVGVNPSMQMVIVFSSSSVRVTTPRNNTLSPSLIFMIYPPPENRLAQQ
jgi:hypothetical protein